MRSTAATNSSGIYFLTANDAEVADSLAGVGRVANSQESATTTAVATWSSYRDWLHHKRLNSVSTDAGTDRTTPEAMKFSALFSTIDEMLALPSGFSDGIDKVTATDAERVLAFIEASGIEAPKIFSHGGDAVVFTWEEDVIGRYVTISDGDAAFLVVNKLTKMQCPCQIVSLNAPQISGLLGSLNAPLKASTNA